MPEPGSVVVVGGTSGLGLEVARHYAKQGREVVLFGGRAKDRPYPGSTMVSTVNGGVTGLVHSLAVELAPIRCNAIHPGIVGDSPYWSAKGEAVLERYRSEVPSRQLTTMQDVVGAVVFLLENRSVTGVDLYIDAGWLLL